VNQGLLELNQGIQDINTAMGHIHELNDKNNSAVHELKEEISEFVLSSEEDSDEDLEKKVREI
jgi:uncharacterized phage infection (PIP) family protein YhgE